MAKRIPLGVIAAYWRLRRGSTLGAQGVVIDGRQRVLLVRHGYRSGWHFPGGGVEWRETAETALAREVLEETGVVVKARPVLHGLFANVNTLPSDHIAVYVVREWERPSAPKPSYEIQESEFFPVDDVPKDTSPGTRRRLAEIFENAPTDPFW